MPLLDTEQLDAMSAGMPELLLPIVTDFATSGRESLTALHAALAGDRFPDAKDQLHQVKGAAGTIGLIQFRDLCMECEQHVLAQTVPPRLAELGPLLEESVQAACAYLNGSATS